MGSIKAEEMNWECNMHRRNNKRVPNSSHKTGTDDSVLRTKRYIEVLAGVVHWLVVTRPRAVVNTVMNIRLL